MTKPCCKCGAPIADGDLIKAVIVTRFKMIPSRVHFSLALPTECTDLQHVDCDDRKGASIDGGKEDD